MTRTHPPTLLTVVGRTLREECALERGATLLVAVSGGPDSMALLHVLWCLRGSHHFELRVCGVDHGLRTEAARELALVRDYAQGLGVPFEVVRLQVEPGGNLHARCRDARYAALERAAAVHACGYLVTGHHADDRAETVLLRLLGGSGLRGLGVLPARAGNRLRPMIRATRAQVMQHVERHQVPHAHDPSNLDPRFARARVRAELLPMMLNISPGIVGHLVALADEALEPALPSVLDEQGRPVQLGRAHREQLRRALRHRRGRARVLIGAGRVIVVDSQTGQPKLERDRRPPDPHPAPRSKLRPGGLKKPKSG